MEREKSQNRDNRTLSSDPGVPGFEGQGREAVDLRRESSHATWPRVPMYEGQARRTHSEQPGVSRVRDTEVDNKYGNIDGERQGRRVLRPQSVKERFLRTPSRSRRSNKCHLLRRNLGV